MPARLAGQGRQKFRSIAMNLRQVIPADMTASVVAHLSVLALVVLFSKVHPFGAVTAEPIAVDIVTAREIENKPEPVDPPKPTTDLSALAKPVADAAPPESQPASPVPTPSQKQAALAAPRPARPQTAVSPAPAYRSAAARSFDQVSCAARVASGYLGGPVRPRHPRATDRVTISMRRPTRPPTSPPASLRNSAAT